MIRTGSILRNQVHTGLWSVHTWFKKDRSFTSGVSMIKSLPVSIHLILSMTFRDSVVIIKRPVTNEYINAGITSSIVMCKVLVVFIAFLFVHPLILLSLTVTYQLLLIQGWQKLFVTGQDKLN